MQVLGSLCLWHSPTPSKSTLMWYQVAAIIRVPLDIKNTVYLHLSYFWVFLPSCPEVAIHLINHGSCEPSFTHPSFIPTGGLSTNVDVWRHMCSAFYLLSDRPLPWENIFLHCTGCSPNCSNTEPRYLVNLLHQQNFSYQFIWLPLSAQHLISLAEPKH